MTLIRSNGSGRLVRAKIRLAELSNERTRRDEALKRSEAFLGEAQRLSCTGSFSWRVRTDELFWSDQLYRIFEVNRNVEVTFAVIDSRTHRDDRPLMHEMRERARSEGGDIECEFRLLMPDGSVKHLHMVAHGTRDSQGLLEYIGAIQDVTRRRVAEDALSKVRLELVHVTRVMSLGPLSASIAHEINQPLSGIITNASTCLKMLSADPPNVEGALETARRTLRDGGRASAVIVRMRALFAKKKTKTGSVDLNDAAREVLAFSLGEFQRNKVILRTELAEDLPRVEGDRVQLQQVILNLLMNASEAMAGVDDRPRQLVLSTERHERDQVRLSVQDAGRGLEAQVMASVFEPFYTTKADGMGIGLFVSRSIIEDHQGCLQVIANDGPGVTFSFSVPGIARALRRDRGRCAAITPWYSSAPSYNGGAIGHE